MDLEKHFSLKITFRQVGDRCEEAFEETPIDFYVKSEDEEIVISDVIRKVHYRDELLIPTW